jgi:hypothetical protein
MDPAAASRRRRPQLFVALIVAATVIGTGLIATRGADAGTGPAGPLAATSSASTAPVPTGTGTTPNTSPFPPSAPTGLVATSVGSHAITLAWTASTPGCCAITGYTLNYIQAFNDVVWVVALGNVTTTTVTMNIVPTSQYRFTVSAKDSLGHSGLSSNAVTVMTPISDTGPDTTPPSAPTNLVSNNVASASPISLSWSPSTDNVGVTGYNVYQFDGLFVSKLLGTVTGTNYLSPTSLPTLAPTPFMTFYVRARDAAGNLSIASNIVNGNPSTPPSSPPPSSAPPSPSAGPPTCRVTYTTTSQWTGGFVASVTIVNSGTTPINGWRLAFTLGGDQRITSAWNARLTQSGAAVTLRNADWNAVIAPHGSTSMGMQGTWTASDAPPSAFLLNDVGCIAG